jgi:hypothetical protein
VFRANLPELPTHALKTLAFAVAHVGTGADTPRAQPASATKTSASPTAIASCRPPRIINQAPDGQPFGSTSSASLCHSLASVIHSALSHGYVAASPFWEFRCKVWHFRLRKTAQDAGGNAPLPPPARLGALGRRNQRYKLIVAKQG